MSKRTLILICSIFLVVPLLFMGCGSGSDGSAGATGATGATGPPGSGVVAEETCVLCHSAGQAFDVNNMHRLNSTTGNPVAQTPGDVNLAVTNVAFGTPVDNNVPVTVTFTFQAISKAGVNITPSIDLTTPGTNDNLAWVSFYAAKMVPAASATDSDEWYGFLLTPGASGSSPYRTAVVNGVGGAVFTRTPNTPAAGTDTYTYTFPTAALRTTDGYVVDNTLMRMGVQFGTGSPSALNTPLLNLFTTDTYYHTQSNRRPFANEFLDVVSGTGAIPAPGVFPVRNAVSTAACNACHDVLAIHGGGRHEVKFCQICHNPRIEVASHPAGGGYDNGSLTRLIHGLHSEKNLGSRGENTAPPPRGIGDFSEVTYPQDIRNCARCHQGPAAADNTYDNWKNKPTMTACGSCHDTISFVNPPPAGKTLHTGGAYANNALCAICHPATGGLAGITDKHATENVTPNNPTVPGTLSNFEYGINSVTVNASNVATIKFFIKRDGAFLNQGVIGNNTGDNVIKRPTGFSGGPSFLFAYALPQDGIAAPADYNNLGRANGQPESLSIVGLPIVAYDNVNFSEYTVTRANAFPAGATMRAVALQAYFTQISGGPGLDNVGRHTFSVHKAVTGDAVRRTAVESGYTNSNNPLTGVPVGCLECHEIFEGHGGSRVSNAQTCVMCHNPNMTSSGRTITASPINSEIVNYFNNDGDPLTVGTNPLTYPEVANNFKELVHGIHGAAKRTTNFVDIRNRLNGIILQGDEFTYPGDPSHCGKCHLNNLYQNIQTTGRLLTTAKITTGVTGETLAQINAARASVPNATDLVNTPAASACGHCHDSVTARSHFIAMGGEVRAPRGTAVLTPPQLAPDVTP
jgi:OmcA/MtrC family decaheme c-type cytochrome